jgi:hypothetical protein
VKQQPLKKIETYTYETPTVDNKECPFSMGVLNLTFAETRALAGFVSQMIVARGDVSRYAFNTDAVAVEEYKKARVEICANCGKPIDGAMVMVASIAGPRLAYHAGCNPSRSKPQEKKEDEPPRNRFSGLDLT